jgi:NADH:ubiquinone oxidoreductase subunit 6 (subunit J)
MMFNLRLMDLYGKTYYHMPSGFWLSILQIFLFIYLIIHDYKIYKLNNTLIYNIISLNNDTNLKIIGSVLYNFCLDYFIIITLILFIAMIGVIVITLDSGQQEKNISVERISQENVYWVNIQLVLKD